MDPGVNQILPHLRQQGQDLLLAPFQNASIEPQRKAFEPSIDLQIVEQTNFLQQRVFSPGPDGDPVPLMHDIFKAGIFNPPFQFRAGVGISPEFAGSVEQSGDPGQ